MNRKIESAKNAISRFTNRAALVGVGAMTTVGSAMAQTGTDVSSITTELTTYKTAVVGLVIAFAVVLWAIKGAGLLKPR